jgi:hypothetical protein
MGSESLQVPPDFFCWTRFGTEAGEPIEQILFRKEQERLANDGIFLWGIGNAVGPSITELIHRTNTPRVIFSPIKGAPRPKDATPDGVVVWTEAEALDGTSFTIPSASLVTSRFDSQTPKNYHFALVCYSSEPLLPLKSNYKVGFKQLRNLRTGRPVGSSQVTAVVQHGGIAKEEQLMYDVAISAELVYPYFVRLRCPQERLQKGNIGRNNNSTRNWNVVNGLCD